MSAILAFLANLFGRLITDSVTRYLALKAVLITLFIVVLPVVLNNVFHHILQQMLEYASQVTTSSGEPVIVQLTGLSAFLASHLKLPESLSVILSALALRFTLNLIPFVG